MGRDALTLKFTENMMAKYMKWRKNPTGKSAVYYFTVDGQNITVELPWIDARKKYPPTGLWAR